MVVLERRRSCLARRRCSLRDSANRTDFRPCSSHRLAPGSCRRERSHSRRRTRNRRWPPPPGPGPSSNPVDPNVQRSESPEPRATSRAFSSMRRRRLTRGTRADQGTADGQEARGAGRFPVYAPVSRLRRTMSTRASVRRWMVSIGSRRMACGPWSTFARGR